MRGWSDVDAQRRWAGQMPPDWVPYVVHNPFVRFADPYARESSPRSTVPMTTQPLGSWRPRFGCLARTRAPSEDPDRHSNEKCPDCAEDGASCRRRNSQSVDGKRVWTREAVTRS
jgi:hypothetical protein